EKEGGGGKRGEGKGRREKGRKGRGEEKKEKEKGKGEEGEEQRKKAKKGRRETRGADLMVGTVGFKRIQRRGQFLQQRL
ncbi:hypothetical protein ACQJ2G_25160, partial [Klebsiella quasipneumoniae]|uniref:hypothetical protein n=1 Tax=Klebsiella quasipneumoniae TaxID=1463165 RepID=UPI003CFD2B55